ncbi:midasin [Hortaea werneckii]|nr:midasin [Hortaea werneckii]
MQLLLRHPSKPVVYLAIRILQALLDGADHWFEQMTREYLGEDDAESGIDGSWDTKVIDYRFLSLWEDQRSDEVSKLLQSAKACQTQRVLPSDAFHPSTTLVGGFLFPVNFTNDLQHSSSEDLVVTSTIEANVRAITSALRRPDPLLLSGLAGSGKSLLARYVARKLGKLDKMVTLHLNEQSDAKLLIGIYTTGDQPGTFVWKPGVLTTAVQEGRWILIEDLDRAPNEIIGTLLPLIESRELLIPSQKQKISAAQGFRILATVRTHLNHRGEETKPLSHMLGTRHWQHVSIDVPPVGEQSQIARKLYPSLAELLPQLMAVYERLEASRQRAVLVGQSKTGILRAISPRDLLKWCSRVHKLLQQRNSFSSSDVDEIFMEAVDCFIGALPEGSARNGMCAVIAEELRIDPQRRDYLLTEREVRYDVDNARINVGRYSLPRAQQQKVAPSSFSTNPHTSRMLERVAAAVINREPLLLVGETGVGKTTAVQHLARHLGKKLEPFNLSQQSEAGDLLGGFKPVTARSLIVPMKDEFDELFRSSFSMTKNQQFLELLNKQMTKSNWKGVCKLWRQALKMVDQQRPVSPSRQGEAPSKKRKVENKKTPDFAKWDEFATNLGAIEKRVGTGSEGFAFSFVEGNIVKAVRNGDWVLLDEINLASPDTLESITDLLDPSAPSLLLTEAGNIERIEAHPGFRVFAAMNPATDVGKKDLPPGIRSRFTELYVESPDKDIKSLQNIVRSYLRTEAAADAAIAMDVSTLYQRVVALADDNKLVDGAGQKPHFSLRTLTRTLSFSKYIAPQCNIRRALYEGFQMSFLTFLDQESARLVQPLLEQDLFGKRGNIRAELNKALRKPEDGRQYVQGWPGSKHWVRRGREELSDQPHYILTPFIQSNLENLVRASSTRQFPVLIQGPTSSGKTSMIEYLAGRTGHKFVRINNHEHTDLQEYLGTYVSGADGRLQFQEGILVRALREGHWIVLDELNLAPTDVLEALNRLLDDNRELLVPETQETVRPHEDFMLFATQNPAGLYGGRKTLSRAFRNRFLELHFDDIPVDELQEILHRRTHLPESRSKRLVTVYRELSVLRQENRLFEQKSFATLRDLFRWALRPNDTIEQLAANGFMLLAERVRKAEERHALKEILEKVMSRNGPRVVIDESALYSQDSPEIRQFTDSSPNQGVVWTKAMRRLYVLVSRAIQNNEPVLLVGETGCGKTTVCQMLADALKQRLHTVNAHQNTETGDLIGSQRPVRNRAVVEATLRQGLLASPALQGLEEAGSLSTDALLHAYDQAVSSLDAPQKQEFCHSHGHADIQMNRTRYKALFEWVDGSLVQAMKEGSFFLLDEISLADDSVLERINSVLESQRTILLAEKGSLDAFVTADPAFQFFATMNPGGDYGKRELSPALRNRFTEIWVPALSDSEDIVQIVSSKLKPDARHCATAIVGFAQWFKARYNTSATSSISIRDALAWVQFVNAFADVDVTIAVVHGAALVYVDTLGANPAGLMTLTGKSLNEERQECLAELSRLVSADASAIYSVPAQIVKSTSQLSIGPFSITNRAGSTALPETFSFDAQTTRNNAMRVLRAMQLAKPVMLEGSPGVGKTALVTAIASAAGVPLTRINLSEQTDLLDLFGSDAPVEGAATGTFAWRDAPFLRAMKNGDWVLLDEMNLASQSVLEGLNACLDHRGEVYVPELGQAFSKHPDFRLFAAQNPHHQGGGRKGLPASFVNRFTVVYADAFRPDDLMLICQRSFPQVEISTLKQAIAFVDRLDDEVVRRRRFGANGGPWEFNLRDVFRWLSLLSSEKGLLQAGNARDCVELLFTQRFRSPTDRAFIKDMFANFFPDTPPAADLYSNTSESTLQVGLALLPRQQWQASMQDLSLAKSTSTEHLRLVESTMLCVQHGWPLILTGPSGSGKTSILHSVASAIGAQVVTISMNAETDAMDLIGGYEQADPLRQGLQALDELKAHLCNMAKMHLLEDSSPAAASLLTEMPRESLPTADALQRIAGFVQSLRLPQLSRLINTIEQCSTAIDKARFEWTDGMLVEALVEGKWLILDNANLCSSSVLDRLNSLLEPNGALIINEHTEEDGSPRVIRPHPEFRIFLVTDPRYGELSRAMRNRAVELFVPSDGPKSLCANIQTESRLGRFAPIVQLPANGSPRRDAVIADHLGLVDRALIPRFLKELERGLSQHTSLPEIEYSASVMQPLQSFYSKAASRACASADYACVQTFHPLNNQALVQQSQTTLAEASTLAFFCDLSAQLMPLLQRIRSFEADQATVRHLERVERSALSKRGSKGSTLLAQLGSMIKVLGQWAEQILPSSDLSTHKTLANRLVAFLTYLTNATAVQQVDSALLTAWISAIQEPLRNVSPANEGLSALATPLQKVISVLQVPNMAKTGLACTALWQRLRPETPPSVTGLEALLNLERVVDRFDDLCRRFSQDATTMTTLRLSFAKSLSVAPKGNGNIEELTQRLEQLMPTNDVPAEDLSDSVQPHFVDLFGALYCHFATLHLNSESLEVDDIATIGLFSKRPTLSDVAVMAKYSSEDDAQRFLRLLSSALPMKTSEESGKVSTPGLESFFKDLDTAGEVSLENLQLLQDENSTLARIVSQKADLLRKDRTGELDRGLRTLLLGVLNVLTSTDVADNDLRTIGLALNSAMENEGDQILESLPLETREATSAIATPLRTVVEYLNHRPSDESDHAKRAAQAWASLASACLTLYISGSAFDPALKPRLIRDVHRQALAHLSSQLEAIRSVRAGLYGESGSLRAQSLQYDIQEMGPEPQVEEVCRPATSQMTQLQGELDGLMRAISQTRKSHTGLDSTLLSNLLQVRSRLQSQYRAYGDITGPVVGFIDCLRVSHELNVAADALAQPRLAEQTLASSTPFVKGFLSTWLSDEHWTTALACPLDQKQTFYLLSLLGARSAVRPLKEASPQLQRSVEETLMRFYQQWKIRLSDDQRKEAAKSSLYRFKGDEDLDEAASDEQIEALFPTQGADSPARSEGERHRSEQRQEIVSSQMAKVHYTLFASHRENMSFWSTLQHFAECGATSSTANNIPAMIRALASSTDRFSQGASGRELYNVYTDSNIEQAKRLHTLLKKVQGRFQSIHAAWPEHATPLDVSRICEHILSFSHSEALTKFLPVLEKLHGTVAEWQKVASRDYTVADVLEDLTTLIISWRQMELSSWAGLLHREADACERAASSWWYIAYETIVLATEQVDQSEVTVKQHAEGLLQTLAGFMSSSGLGEYRPRLQILRDFVAHLSAFGPRNSAEEIVRQALANFISYHQHFEEAVSEKLNKGRAELEKDIKNVIQVASWKDRNIELLKQSAKSSHKKLLRVVRKFRNLLAQPVSALLQSGVPNQELPNIAHSNLPELVSPAEPSNENHAALTNLKLWNLRPDRFQNPGRTAALVQNKCVSINSPSAATERISSFVGEVGAAIAELQRATPSTLTEENKKSVQYLKGRKRRLLADVLRDARNMGFQSNIGEDTLKEQAAAHIVLAKIPALPEIEGFDTVAAADHSLHRLLGIMPDVREFARKHSEDLTPAEAARSLALLESMLQSSIKQRTGFGQHLRDAANLESTLKQLAAFASSSSPRKDQNKEANSITARIICFDVAIDTAARLVQSQSGLGHRAYDKILQDLRSSHDSLQNLQGQAEQMGQLPDGVCSDASLSLQFDLNRVAVSVHAYTSIAIKASPELEPVLSHLHSWSASDVDSGSSSAITANDNIAADANAWTEELLRSLDDVLTTVQQFGLTGRPAEQDDNEKAWLIQQTDVCFRNLSSLRADHVQGSIRRLIHSLPHMHTDVSLSALASACRQIFPILQAYRAAYEKLILDFCQFHIETNRMAFHLATSFSTLCQQGFCQPPDKADGDAEKSGDVEAGTGLGEGEGGEDISKDVGDDEDLGELAQEGGEKNEKQDIEDQQDAVDMADQEMEGQVGDGPEGGEEEGGEGDDKEGQEDGEMEEESGQVDDLGPGTVDEKMWDEGQNEEAAERESDEAKRSADQQEMAAGKEDKGDDSKAEKGNDQQEEQDAEEPDDEAEAIDQQKPEGMDQHVEDQQNLDLPEDVNMDGEKEADEGSDFGSLDDMEEKGAEDDAGQDPETSNDQDEGADDGDEDIREDEAARTQDAEDADAEDPDADAQSDTMMRAEEDKPDDQPEQDVFGEAGTGADQEAAEKKQSHASATAEQEDDQGQEGEEQEQTDADSSGKQRGARTEDAQAGAEQSLEEQSGQPYKQMGNVLEEWYRQNRQIEQASQQQDNNEQQDRDIDMADATFEHLPDDQTAADTQALGAANAEQSTALDEKKGLPVNDQLEPEGQAFDDSEDKAQEEKISEGENEMEPSDALQAQDLPNAFVGEPRGGDIDMDMADAEMAPDEDQVRDVDQQLNETHLDPAAADAEIMSLEEARSTWSEHEASTRNLALILTEHLRLILQPTQATKMRGDFRTGKRLNIKRIIPYIASSYKRDKIWMRRSVPSKRSYQIMLAIDDSKSMAESESRGLAFETLALVAKAMSMLEVGELSVVGFGEDVKIAHDFSTPFTSEAGAEVFRQFTFAQRKTNVRKLLTESIEYFREARLKAAGSASELWQLQLIISDGVCEDHPSIRQLVRQAHEERIMVVFVVVDAAMAQTQAADGSNQSILDLQTAEFVKNTSGEMEVKMLKYLDTFPFNYYLVVRDVQELPTVLAGALRQWFAEVVESG